MTADLIAVGCIVGPQGVHGQFKVKLFAENPNALMQYGALRIDDGRVLPLTVRSVNSKGLVIVSSSGITSREAAEDLRGMLLSTARANLPNLNENEVYHADIIGTQVFHKDGNTLGVVLALYNFGAGEIVEVKPKVGSSVMLPFEGDYVVSIELENNRVILDPPVGLLDDNTNQSEK